MRHVYAEGGGRVFLGGDAEIYCAWVRRADTATDWALVFETALRTYVGQIEWDPREQLDEWEDVDLRAELSRVQA